MFSRRLLYFLFFLLMIFIGNIILYHSNEDYNFLIKKLKHQDDTPIVGTDVNDDYTLGDEFSLFDDKERNTASGVINTSGTGVQVTTGEKQADTNADMKLVALNAHTQEILGLFEEYRLQKITMHGSLFDMTTEYPDEYLEYMSNNLTLYFFPTKTYAEVTDIFFAISQSLPFTLNKSNSFGDASFFINLHKEFQDEYVRMIIQSKNDVFGLKIKKDIYNAVKAKLQNIQ